MEKDSRFLIVGASGFIGRHLYARLSRESTIATYCRHPIEGGVYFEASRMRLSEKLLRGNHGIACAFLLGGIGKLEQCARDPNGTGRVNVDGIKRMIDDLEAAGVKIIFTSSDGVFDGTRGQWTENDPATPILTYGKQKVAVENYLIERGSTWVIARLSKVVGVEPDAHNLIGEWLREIERGDVLKCARDLIFSPIAVEDVVTALIRLAEGPFAGIFNVCGPRSMSRLELLDMLVKEIQRYKDVQPKIIPCSIRDFSFIEERPLDLSMSPKKLLAALGISLEEMENVCRRAAMMRFGKQDRTIVRS
ncbi:MAG TPA: sugar nucleotide-binding protein [Acidobacteriota bacterium]|nr:sugar nucleotide-binding protein [Acidobacteriota bacterium]